jgi:hypothetical protein
MNSLHHFYIQGRNLSLLTIMITESSLLTMKLTPHLVLEQVHVHGWNWRSAGAVCGLCFGIISPLIGSILTAFAWFTGPNWHGFFIQRDGTVLLFLTIPLLIFGAHCLDLMDKHDEEPKNHSVKPFMATRSRNKERKSNDLERD